MDLTEIPMEFDQWPPEAQDFISRFMESHENVSVDEIIMLEHQLAQMGMPEDMVHVTLMKVFGNRDAMEQDMTAEMPTGLTEPKGDDFPFKVMSDRCPPGQSLDADSGECVPEGMKKANQTERIHHVANSAMNHRPKEVGPVTMMDTDPNEMPRQNMGWPQNTSTTSGVFAPLEPTIQSLEPSSSNEPCNPGDLLNPVNGECEPENLITQNTQEKINYPDHIEKIQEGCGCNNVIEKALENIESQ